MSREPLPARASSRRGVSLLELTIAMFIFLLIMAAVYYLFTGGRRQAERPRATAQIQESLAQVVRYLQRDLSETNLQTIRSFPNASYPSVSLRACRWSRPAPWTP